ncbi:hypothetical protein AMK15_27580 [Streptomyces sp. MJM1172]|nr:hypothetical protein AMK15_27580 [Streptomyces sp. MJM1172]
MAIDLVGAPRGGESCGDGIEITPQAAEQRMEGWAVVSKDSFHPVRKLVSAEVVEHFSEVVDVPCACVEMRAGRTVLLQFRSVGGREVLGMRHDPADETSGLRSRPGRMGAGWR